MGPLGAKASYQIRRGSQPSGVPPARRWPPASRALTHLPCFLGEQGFQQLRHKVLSVLQGSMRTVMSEIYLVIHRHRTMRSYSASMAASAIFNEPA